MMCSGKIWDLGSLSVHKIVHGRIGQKRNSIFTQNANTQMPTSEQVCGEKDCAFITDWYI